MGALETATGVWRLFLCEAMTEESKTPDRDEYKAAEPLSVEVAATATAAAKRPPFFGLHTGTALWPRAPPSIGHDAVLANVSWMLLCDGAGSWETVGVDPGLAARGTVDAVHTHLLSHPEALLPGDGPGVGLLPAVRAALQDMDYTNKGSTTFAAVTLSGDAKGRPVLQCMHIGDGYVLVFRAGDGGTWNAAFEVNCAQSRHAFNTPLQLGNNRTCDRGAWLSALDKCTVAAFHVEVGDIVVLTSDGVADNLYVSEIAEILTKFTDVDAATPSMTSTTLATRIAVAAKHAAISTLFPGRTPRPYSLHCQAHGQYTFGGAGKHDDVSVAVGVVTECDA